MDQTAIDQYAAGGQKLRASVEGLSHEDLVAFPIPGTWSIQQIVVHVMDSELTGSDRMKRIIAMENPLLMGYDETLFSQRLFYQQQPIAAAVDIVDLNRRMFADVLKQLPTAAFERAGIHSEVGKVTLGSELKKYNWHLEHHLKFIVEKRAKLGKPLKE